MFKTLAFVAAAASVALAQNTTSQTNPLIPTGLSDTCKSFYISLDTDSSLSSCLGAMNSATSAFSPTGSGTVSKAVVTQALGSLCSDSVANACPESLIRTTLTNFYTACSAELTSQSPNPQVLELYEILYVTSPMRTSICSKDDSGSYCVFSAHGSTANENATPSIASVMQSLYNTAGALRRRAATTYTPNLSTFGSNNIAFLYYSNSLDATALCTACARSVVTAYMNFESNVPYAPGVSQSKMLVNQQPLVDAINSKCPSGFLSGAVKAAGGLSKNSLLGAAVPSVSCDRQTALGLAMGLAAAISFF